MPRPMPGLTPFMEWMDEYRVDIEAIDRQHQGIVALINEVHHAMLTDAPPLVMDGIVRKLTTYAEEHFDFEEQCMELCHFSHLTEHRCQHREMMRRITAFGAGIQEGDRSTYQALLDFLMEWLGEHILKSDHRYKDALHAAGLR
ncbi:MAG: hemerythrin family protein [Bacteroidetes bacterium]|nr:hemerythrin family protein [Bacteroidota bacterium]